MNPEIIGALIHDNAQLNRFLLALAPNVREEVYGVILPHLTFEPKPNFSFKSSPA